MEKLKEEVKNIRKKVLAEKEDEILKLKRNRKHEKSS